ncbi:WXG100 family type VII secretion target [Streptomyces sp. ISID311]|uniref:WXG100 family type VII secretion target n=1 Tax=Streptomyces sp. ISID311 TaxID=2601673 RepID=UPI0011BD3031|nr:WXG100 family type VII secretion target [Streptomyces sp. ISID311]TXC99885.1 WXG100 family type VII secretion target [Streptomyces sp. ISID311]
MPDNFTDGNIYVDYQHSDNAAEDMILQTQAIAKTLESLEMELGELRKTWYGNDAEVYNQKQAAWDQAVKNMENLLNSHAGLLTDIVGNYKYSEGRLAEMWSEVKIGR